MGTKVFDNALDLITFTRASGGTALRRIGYGPELVTNGTFDTDVSGWAADAPISIAAVSGALEITFDTGAPGGAYTSASTVAGKVYQVSFDIVSGANPDIYIRNGSHVGTTLTFFTLGAPGNSYSLFFKATGSSTVVYLYSATSTAGSTMSWDNISVKEVIFDRASDPLVLFNHPTNVPRIEYDASGALKGLLIEEARTNLLLRSEEFNNASWTKNSASIAANAAVAPDGELTADLVTLSGNGFVLRGTPTVATTQYTHSVFVKKGTADYFLVYLGGGGAGGADAGIIFNLTTKAFHGTLGGGTILSYGVVDVGGGWLRLYAVGAAGDTSTDTLFRPCNAAGTGVSGDTAYVWGAQLEAGAFPTSYIPTAGATATRSADIASIPVSAFGYNQRVGSVVVEARSLNVAGNAVISALTDGTANEQARLQAGVGNQFVVFDGGVSQAAISGGSFPNDTFAKLSAAYKVNDFAACLSGGTVGTDVSGSVNDATHMTLGVNATSIGTFLNGHIKSIAYYPRRLSNTQLQDLTS